MKSKTPDPFFFFDPNKYESFHRPIVEKSRFDAQLNGDRWETAERFIIANQPLFHILR
jgi:hypothetical protein